MRKIVFFLVCAALAAGCKSSPAGVEHIIFDTDLGNDVDDAVALVMLHRYASSGTAEIVAEGITKDGSAPAACMDIFNAWYGHPDVPFGIIVNGADCETDAVNYAKAVADLPAFKGSLESYDALPESHVLYRDILAKEADHSVTLVVVGFSTNVARLLDLDKDLMIRKVKRIVMMAGRFDGEKTSEYNVWKDIPSARKVVEEWPGEIVFSPFELGIQVNYPASVIEERFAAPEPLTEAYKAYLPMPYNRPCWDPTALLYAVEGDGWFTVSEPGTVHIDENGITTFEPDPEGHHRILSVDEAQAQALVDRIVELTTPQENEK